jgi:cell division protein FtsN
MIYQRLETHQIEEKEPAQLLPDSSDESYPPLEAQLNASVTSPTSSQSALNSLPEQANFDAWPKATPAHMAARKTQTQPTNNLPEGALLSGGVPAQTAIQQQPVLVQNPAPAPLAEATVNTLPTKAFTSYEDARPTAHPVSQNDGAPTAGTKTVHSNLNAISKKDQPATKALSPHSFRLQIASLSSMKAAETEKKRLWTKHKNILGKLDGKIMQVDLGNSGVRYRVVAGPVSSHNKAKELCSKLSTVKVGCIIMKPGT